MLSFVSDNFHFDELSFPMPICWWVWIWVLSLSFCVVLELLVSVRTFGIKHKNLYSHQLLPITIISSTAWYLVFSFLPLISHKSFYYQYYIDFFYQLCRVISLRKEKIACESSILSKYFLSTYMYVYTSKILLCHHSVIVLLLLFSWE